MKLLDKIHIQSEVFRQVISHKLFLPCVSLSLTSFLLSALIIWIFKSYPVFFGDRALFAIQRSHQKPTPRLGGVAIFASLSASLLFVPSGITANYLYFVLSAGILFAIGLIEDVTGRIGPWMRLLAAFIACLCYVALRGVWLREIGLSWFDSNILAYAPFAIAFTILLVSGIANGFNIIDGVNGLAAFAGLAACVAQFMIARHSGYPTMQVLNALLAASILGFFIINFPRGPIFLGDAGAYTIGFALSWFGVLTISHESSLSPWAILMTVFWPFFETAVSFVRRLVSGLSTMRSDDGHTHHITKRLIENYWFGGRSTQIANPISAVMLFPFIGFPPVLGVLYWNNEGLARSAFAVVFVTYSVLYFLIQQKR